MKTYYYSDELNDDFAGTNIKQKELPADYQYFSRNPLKKFFEFILYRLIVTPIIFLSQKLVFRVKIKNRRVLKARIFSLCQSYGCRQGRLYSYTGHISEKGLYYH